MTTAEVTSYTELMGVIRARIGDLGIRYEDFDVLAGFAPGLSGKVFGPSQVKRLGPEKLFDAMRAAAIKLSAQPDAEQLEKMRKQIAEKCQVRQANQARMNNSASPISKPLMNRVFGHFLREGRKKRWVGVSKKKRSEHARMMAMARVRKDRKRMKAARSRKQRLARAATAQKETAL
jgi:hypothetical protein